jgi:dephospho-CoA kinase
MAKVPYKEIVGVCGLIGCGKSYAAKLIAKERDYLYVSADDAFKQDVITNPTYINKLQEFLDIFEIPAVVDGIYNSNQILKLIFNDAQKKYEYPILKALNKLNSHFVADALRERLFGMRDCILEMATLPKFEPFTHRLQATIMVMGDGWNMDKSNSRNHVDRVFKRDNRGFEYTKHIIYYQSMVMLPYLTDKSIFRLENMNTDFEHEDDVTFAPSFKKDYEILDQFDEIIKSSRALTHVKLTHGS